jgi:hypothetical protein
MGVSFISFWARERYSSGFEGYLSVIRGIWGVCEDCTRDERERSTDTQNGRILDGGAR